jgi:hypothetical protein
MIERVASFNLHVLHACTWMCAHVCRMFRQHKSHKKNLMTTKSSGMGTLTTIHENFSSEAAAISLIGWPLPNESRAIVLPYTAYFPILSPYRPQILFIWLLVVIVVASIWQRTEGVGGECNDRQKGESLKCCHSHNLWDSSQWSQHCD